MPAASTAARERESEVERWLLMATFQARRATPIDLLLQLHGL